MANGKCKCKGCGYEWQSRIKNPKSCPECKRRDWKPPTEEQKRAEYEELKARKDREKLRNHVKQRVEGDKRFKKEDLLMDEVREHKKT